MTFAIQGLLVVIVLAVWLGCVGFMRLRSPLDRMHCVAFVNTTAGTALVLAAFLSDGISVRALKILLIIGISLLAGAAMSHAVGRALVLRGSAPEAAASGAEASIGKSP
ncbi:monovalent cation/H(+) antiporter subunit G [Rhodopila sp.]|uniref:monovalent cation/H(+) antiporter subunit G n=1 Tax=Rhodopila sp. TaxID=2480087 RepID=UPI003D126857